ncbi:MAG: glycosyltransferase family 2 protein, partial [Sulfuricurvum sp.]|nr:glycosyltransferase family 2 protein [Sulfuricurvum sp.]
YARQIPYSNADAIEIFARTTNYPEHSIVKSKKDLPAMGIKTFFSSDSCAMYRGDYFRSVGGFTLDLNTNEDMEFAARAILNGKKIAYAHEAKVYHSHNFTLLQVWQRYRQIGKFFADNHWILNAVAHYSNAESTGIRQAVNELKYLFQKAPLKIPKSIVLSLTKYIAFKSSFY